jgi:hypothetical protein
MGAGKRAAGDPAQPGGVDDGAFTAPPRKSLAQYKRGDRRQWLRRRPKRTI